MRKKKQNLQKKAKIILWQRLHYLFDNIMSGGIMAVIGWLALISTGFIFLSAAIISFTHVTQNDGTDYNFSEAAWMSMLRTLDAGTMGADTGWEFRIIMLIVTLGGIFIVSTLIGILSSGIERKIEELRKGRSVVLENSHTLILGWSTKIYSILSELIIANSNRYKCRIVILADKDKLEMEDLIKARIKIPRNTKIICRSGNPMGISNLEMVNVNKAKSIIILDDPNDEMFVIKAMLALVNNPNRKSKKYNIVAEIGKKKNLVTAQMVGGEEANFVLSDELISRIIVQTCRYEGLSNVYVDLLDFSNDEIYFKLEPELVGKTFADAISNYEKSSVVGIRAQSGQVKLNPPMSTIINPGDKIIVIAEDDDTIKISSTQKPEIHNQAIIQGNKEQTQPKQILILGWNNRGTLILNELDNYMVPGTQVTVVAETPDLEKEIIELQPEIKNVALKYIDGDINNRALLDQINILNYNHLIILCHTDVLSATQADAKTLIALLHVRDILQKQKKNMNIVVEMADIQDVELAKITKEDDFIVSDILASLMIAQLSENPELKTVFENLFNPVGSELYIKNAKDFIQPGKAVNFYTVVESARRQNQIAVGYRIQSQSTQHKNNYGIVLNPRKSGEIIFAEDDKLIVIAEGK